MDETTVDCTYGKLKRGFTSSGKRSGGYIRVKSSYGLRKQIKAVISASAAGDISPPFFIIAGKRISSDWYAPVTGKFQKEPDDIIAPFTTPDWFLGDVVITVSDNGSMEGNVLAPFVQHLDEFARRFVAPEDKILLCLDGHSSRKDIRWLNLCLERNIECFVNAANSSHFLQPCEQQINKRFHDCMREIRDEFCKQGNVDTTKVNFNLAFSVYAMENIGTQHVSKSFSSTGIFPFERNFAHRYWREDECFKKEMEGLRVFMSQAEFQHAYKELKNGMQTLQLFQRLRIL